MVQDKGSEVTKEDDETTVQLEQAWTVVFPESLNEDTKALLKDFVVAMAKKLKKAEDKYGYHNGWRDTNWMDECRTQLINHLMKGDPIDVAAYCAFLWYHNEPTIVKE